MGNNENNGKFYVSLQAQVLEERLKYFKPYHMNGSENLKKTLYITYIIIIYVYNTF